MTIHHISSKRRAFLRSLAAAGLAAGVGVSDTRSKRRLSDPPAAAAGGFAPVGRALARELPLHQGQPDERPALARRFPPLAYSRNNPSRLQIGNVLAPDFPLADRRVELSGPPGETLFRLGGVRHLLPWAPLFPKPTPLHAASPELAGYAGAGQLFIKDEGSERLALYGNKVRKYEYALPNIAYGGGRKIVTFGGLGSNHCTFATLAARLAHYLDGQRVGGLAVRLGLYPQRPDPVVVAKLRFMAALGAEMEFLPRDLDVGLALARQRLLEILGMAGGTVYMEPGGSSFLTVLGHLDAAFELDEQIRSGTVPLEAAPDFIFVPLGSGATSMGLALGCHLLGWPTRVVATASQDKPAWIRLLFNGNLSEPFTVGHARNLLEACCRFLRRCDLESTCGCRLDADAVLEHHFACDNETWKPAYGVPSEFSRGVLEACGDMGLVLDPTFSGKSFSTLVRYGRAGRLQGRRILFWNTHHRFPFQEIRVVRELPLSRLPGPLRDYLAWHGMTDGDPPKDDFANP